MGPRYTLVLVKAPRSKKIAELQYLVLPKLDPPKAERAKEETMGPCSALWFTPNLRRQCDYEENNSIKIKKKEARP